MAVLIVRKPTNLEQHGSVVSSRQSVSMEQLELLKKAHLEHYRCLDLLRAELNYRGIVFTEVNREDAWPNQAFDAVFTVGGDGTLLTASHLVEDGSIPFIGLRSSEESVGYLCAGGSLEIRKIISGLENESLVFEQRQRLRAIVTKASDGSQLKSSSVLNDLLYTNSNPAATTRYNIQFGDCKERQKSSGIWFATPTGSTAAISAAGGFKQKSDEKVFQFAVRELYQPQNHSISKSRFDPDRPEDSLVIENHCSDAILAQDGDRGIIGLSFGDSISFERAVPLKIAASLVS